MDPQPIPGTPVPTPSDVRPTHEGLGIASLVTGILSFTCCCIAPVSWGLSVIAIGLGVGSILKVNQQPQAYRGRGMAIAGISAGAFSLILTITLSLLFTQDRLLELLPPELREQVEAQQRRQREVPPEEELPAPTDDDAADVTPTESGDFPSERPEPSPEPIPR